MIHDVEFLRLWLSIVAVIASICVTSLPAMYVFSPWRSRPIGKFFMQLVLSLAVAMDVNTLFIFWRPNIVLRLWINAIVLTGLAISAAALTILMWRLNHTNRKKVVNASHRQGLRRS